MENKMDVTILPRTEDLAAWLFWLVIVILLLLWDVVKAWMRRAFWFPGQALVLSALIIQLLSCIDYSNISVYSGSSYETKEVLAILVKNQLVIDSGRLMMYVLIAYLLPGMARSGSISDASTLAVLALSITFQVVSEVRSHWKVEKRNESLSALAASSEGFDRIISYLCSTILILAIIYLLWLLMRAIMVGRSIRRIMSQRIRSALSCCTPGHQETKDLPGCEETKDLPRCEETKTLPRCKETKDHVLKCWIVVRLSQPDYVLARSGLCSMVCRIVTACIVLHVIKWRHVQFTDNESRNSVTQRKLVQFVIVGQFVIILIGWIVLFVRGVTSGMHGDIFSGDYFKSVSIEDALTDLAAYFIRAYFLRVFFKGKRTQEQNIRAVNKKIRAVNQIIRYIYSLLSGIKTLVIESVPRHCVQIFSGPWVQNLFQNFPMQNPRRWLPSTPQWVLHVIESVSIAGPDDDQFSMYKGTLEILKIEGEIQLSLWKANQRGFSRVKRYMEQGQKAGNDSPRELTDLLVLAEGEADRERLEQLQQRNKNSWKRTAVSLIHLMINSYENSHASVIEKAMKCYIQAWEYMHFVDGLNEEVKSLDWQTDEEFERLQHRWETIIKDSQEELSLDVESNMPNSTDSTEVAEDFEETLKIIDKYRLSPHDSKIFLLERALANVYFVCMKEDLNKAVIEKCRKLAEEGMEEEILDVAFLAAKAQGALDKVREGHNTDQASTSSHILTVSEQVGEENDPVEPRHNTDQASTSSPIPTVKVGNNRFGNNSVVSSVVGHNAVGNNAIVHNTVGHNSVVGNNAIVHNTIWPNSVYNTIWPNSVVGGKGAVGYNAVIGNSSNIRLRRPNDSLTDQTEIAVADEEKSIQADEEKSHHE